MTLVAPSQRSVQWTQVAHPVRVSTRTPTAVPGVRQWQWSCTAVVILLYAWSLHRYPGLLFALACPGAGQA